MGYIFENLVNSDLSAEVGRLPGCGPRIAELYHEYRETGKLGEVEKTEKDTKLSVLRIFYNILFVGDHIAKELYNKGWRDLDGEYLMSLTRQELIISPPSNALLTALTSRVG